jgi:NodT family efflux transporter outer membrane factor (OMF) lipoprotein
MTARVKSRRPLVVPLVAFVLTGCAVGPDYQRPATPVAERYTRDPLPSKTAAVDTKGGEEQKFVSERDIPADWWTLFGSSDLNRLIEEALTNSPNIQAAQAALRQAQELVRAQQGIYYPSVRAGYTRLRQRDSATLGPTLDSGENPFNLHTAQITVSYVPDVFGGLRRQVESLQAQADAQRFEYEATYIALTTNIVTVAVQEASLRAQLKAAQEIIAVNRKSLGLLRQQFAAGLVSGLDVAAQEAATAQAEQAVPPLRKQLEQTRNLLTALIGRIPANGSPATFELSTLRLPGELPISLPSRLVEQRPDVRAAEQILRARSAEVGVATAALLPQFTIEAAKGGMATTFGQMFSSGNPFWAIAGSISQTVFAGGTLLAQKRAAEAAFDQAAAQYRGTVILAFQNVADALTALETDADSLRAAVDSERAAKRSLDLVTKQLEVGSVNYLALLNAQQTYQQALIRLAQARADRLSDTAALFQALGGGWWNKPSPQKE